MSYTVGMDLYPYGTQNCSYTVNGILKQNSKYLTHQ